MAYLPRMSKTYKEPEERKHEEAAKEIIFNSIPIASALPDEKAHNPQTVLQQYNFYPHPPPQLPGPSLIQEVEQNEKVSVQVKRRRTKEESVLTLDKGSTEEFPYENVNKTTTINVVLTATEPPKADNVENAEIHVIPPETVTEKVSKKPYLTINPFEELSRLETKSSIKENEEKTTANETESVTLTSQRGILKTAVNEVQSINASREKDDSSQHSGSGVCSNDTGKRSRCGAENFEILDDEKRNVHKSLIHQGVQCHPHGLSEKTFTMPCSVHYLMKTLSFLVLELDKKEKDENAGATKEVKKLLHQINESIAGILGCRTIPDYALQTSVSDVKRLEKIHNDLEEYIKLVYGERGKFGYKCEEKKNMYCKLSQKDYELKFLHEKLREGGIQTSNLKFPNSAVKSPEVVLQNKNLENEQLAAEIEFGNEELMRIQMALAETNWEIQKYAEDMAEVKKQMAIFKCTPKK